MSTTRHVPSAGGTRVGRVLPEGAPLRRFLANEVIFLDGDAVDALLEVAQGVVRLCKLLADGRRAVLGFRYPGELLETGWARRHGTTAEAVTAVVLRTSRRPWADDTVAGAPELHRRLSALLWAELDAAQANLLLLGRMTATERVAHFLLGLARRARADEPVDLPMSRLDIADHLGLTVETVSRIISRLRRQGLIALQGTSRIRLLRPATLRALAGSDEHAWNGDDATALPGRPIPACMPAHGHRQPAAMAA